MCWPSFSLFKEMFLEHCFFYLRPVSICFFGEIEGGGQVETGKVGRALRVVSYTSFLVLMSLGVVALWQEELLTAIVSFLLAHLAHDLSD